MSGQSITNLNPTPQNNNDAVTKGYVDNQIKLSCGLSLSGITMQGDIIMNGNEISGLADPINDDMAASKGFVGSNFLDLAGGTMVGNVDMGGYEMGGKTKITLGEWMDTFDNVNFVDYNWSKHVRKSTLNSESNIEIRVASFVTDMSISQLLKHKLIIGIRYVDSSSTISKHLVTISLSGKSFSKLSYGGSGGSMYSFHIHEEYYVGNDSDAKNSFLWQVGAKFESTKSHVLLDTSAHVSFALNEAGQYG